MTNKQKGTGAGKPAAKPPKYAVFAENFNKALDAAGFPGLHYGRQVAVGQAFDISPSAARKWVMGDCLPDNENLLKIADKLKVGLDTLFGRAPRLGSSPMVDIHICAPAQGAGKADGDWKESFSAIQMEASWLESGMRLKSDNLFAMMVRGDNMHPTLSDGDTVFVDSTPVTDVQEVEDCGIYLIMAKGRPQIRRIQLGMDNKVTLTSDNRQFPSITVSEQDFQPAAAGKEPTLKILGKISWAMHRVGRTSIGATEAVGLAGASA